MHLEITWAIAAQGVMFASAAPFDLAFARSNSATEASALYLVKLENPYAECS